MAKYELPTSQPSVPVYRPIHQNVGNPESSNYNGSVDDAQRLFINDIPTWRLPGNHTHKHIVELQWLLKVAKARYVVGNRSNGEQHNNNGRCRDVHTQAIGLDDHF